MTDTPPTMTPTSTAASSSLMSPITPDPVGTPDMSYVDFVKKCFQPYANFNGRSRRKEYGSFCAAYVIAIVGLFILQMIVGLASGGHGIGGLLASLIGLVSFAVFAGALVPYVGVSIRRVHDAGLPAWTAAVAIVLGFLGIIALLVVPSQDGANIYGPYSKPR